MSLKWTGRKDNFKNPRWRTADTHERPVLHYRETSRILDFRDGGCTPSWILEIEIFNSRAFERHVLRVIMPNFMEIGHTVERYRTSPRLLDDRT